MDCRFCGLCMYLLTRLFWNTSVSSSSSWLRVALSFSTAILSLLGLVSTKTTALLNCFIGMGSTRYTVSCALTSLWDKKADQTFLIWVLNSSVLTSEATCFSISSIALSVFMMYEATYMTQAYAFSKSMLACHASMTGALYSISGNFRGCHKPLKNYTQNYFYTSYHSRQLSGIAIKCPTDLDP